MFITSARVLGLLEAAALFQITKKLPFNLNPGCLFKYSPLFSI